MTRRPIDPPHHCEDVLFWVKQCRKANSAFLETTDVGLWLAVACEVIVDQHYQIVRLQKEREMKP